MRHHGRQVRAAVTATVLAVLAGLVAAPPSAAQPSRHASSNAFGHASGQQGETPAPVSAEVGTPVFRAPTAVARNRPPLLRRTGALTSRAAGMPTSAEPARRFVSASVTQDLERGRISATVKIGAVADRSTESNLWIGFGRLDGATCDATLAGYVNTRPGSGHLADYRSDGTISFEQVSSEARTANWNCAVAVLAVPGDANAQHDVVVGALTDVRAAPAPRLGIAAASQVSVKQRAWKKVRVTVRNPGTGPARATRVRFRGAGVAVRPAAVSLGVIRAGAAKHATVRVRAAGRTDRQLAVRATSGKLRAAHRIAVRPSFRARPPVPGSYRGPNGVSFTITKARTITRWKAPVRQQCNYGVDAWWITTTLGFPRAAIGRGGKVARTVKATDHTKRLTALVDGKRVVRGTFSYAGPGNCSGARDWTATRTGR